MPNDPEVKFLDPEIENHAHEIRVLREDVKNPNADRRSKAVLQREIIPAGTKIIHKHWDLISVGEIDGIKKRGKSYPCGNITLHSSSSGHWRDKHFTIDIKRPLYALLISASDVLEKKSIDILREKFPYWHAEVHPLLAKCLDKGFVTLEQLCEISDEVYGEE